MAQEYLKEYLRLTSNENLEEAPASVNLYYQNPNQYRLNVPPKMTYEPPLLEAETHRFQTTYQQSQPPRRPATEINSRVVEVPVTRPYKPSPSPVVNGYEYQNETLYDREPPDQEQSSTMYGRTFGYGKSRNPHGSAAAASSTQKNGQNYYPATTTANNNIKTANKNRNRPYVREVI